MIRNKTGFYFTVMSIDTVPIRPLGWMGIKLDILKTAWLNLQCILTDKKVGMANWKKETCWTICCCQHYYILQNENKTNHWNHSNKIDQKCNISMSVHDFFSNW